MQQNEDHKQTNIVAWLRNQGLPSIKGMEAAEAQWCANMNTAADEIERLREFVEWVTSRWGEQCHVGEVAAHVLAGGKVGDKEND